MILFQNSNLDSIKESFTLELTSKKRTIENEICKINAILEKNLLLKREFIKPFLQLF
jgi:carboxyl-terminal processing protease